MRYVANMCIIPAWLQWVATPSHKRVPCVLPGRAVCVTTYLGREQLDHGVSFQQSRVDVVGMCTGELKPVCSTAAGTVKHVHVKCLRAWRVMRSRTNGLWEAAQVPPPLASSCTRTDSTFTFRPMRAGPTEGLCKRTILQEHMQG